MDPPPLIAHVIHRLGIGGLENGLVNLLNHLPEADFRHAVICLTDATTFKQRIKRDDVTIHALHKREGKDPAIYSRLWRLFRRLRPRLVHSRNLAALDAQLPALLAGVAIRVHGEHGRDIYDLTGDNRKYLLLRRALRPAITRYVPMSKDLASWLRERVGVPDERITQIYNGVDVDRYRPDPTARERWPLPSWRRRDLVLVGSVGRMEAVKDPLTLARAFVELYASVGPSARKQLRFVHLGDGPLRVRAEELFERHGLSRICWLPGARDDVPDLLPALDVFVLPSLGEGISNTILEAMACALPVIATDVGGNSELVTGQTGTLVPSDDARAMAGALAGYLADPGRLAAQGRAGRRRIETSFALPVMIHRYHSLYSGLLGRD